VSVRQWSGRQVVGVACGWMVLAFVLGLPRVVHVFTARGTGGYGGMVGLHVTPTAWVLLLTAVCPAIALLAIWLVTRTR
jgi:hypothetical protein